MFVTVVIFSIFTVLFVRFLLICGQTVPDHIFKHLEVRQKTALYNLSVWKCG